MKLVDTNPLLRFVTNDVPVQAKQAAEWFENAETRSLLVPDAVLAEFCFVLEFNVLYKFERSAISAMLADVQGIASLRFSPYASRAVEMYRSDRKLDFTDCLLASQAEADAVGVLTFDKRLTKLLR